MIIFYSPNPTQYINITTTLLTIKFLTTLLTIKFLTTLLTIKKQQIRNLLREKP